MDPNNKEISNQNNNNINTVSTKTNPNHYFDLIIGAAISTHLSKFNAENGFNTTNIFILIAMLSITEMQNIVKIGCSELYGFIKGNYKPVFTGIYNSFNFNMFRNYYRYNSKNDKTINIINDNITYDDNNYITIDIHDISLEFMEAFYNVLYYGNDKNIICKYSITDEKIFKYVNMTTEHLSEIYYNIHLQYENINIELMNKLNYTAELCNNRKKIISCNLIKSETNKKNNVQINYLHQLVNDKFMATVLELIHESLIPHYQGNENKNIQVDVIKDSSIIDNIKEPIAGKQIHNDNIDDNYIFLIKNLKSILKILKYNYPDLILSVSYLQLYTIVICINYLFCFTNSIARSYKLYFLDLQLNIPIELNKPIKLYKYGMIEYFSNSYLMYIYNNLEQITIVHSIYNNFYNLNFVMFTNLNFYCKKKEPYNTTHMIRILNMYREIKFEKNDIKKNEIEKNDLQINDKILKFNCKGKDNADIITANFHKLIKEIKTYSNILQTTNENIEIHTIKINKNITEECIDNPEYNEYLEKKELLKCNNDRKDDFLMNELMHQKIPDKKITNIKITKEIKTDLINTTFKTFDTLYLKENDEKKLKSVISKFHSKKEQLKSLGLPNKLCVLLDGKPGTGKSSVIITIATYLKKNIYYISFDKIETNDDLQNIIDHVIKNCNGGIIVCEDIDAIGNFLHKRVDDFVEITTAETNNTKNNTLTMAYFLNLLQGTITPDGLIFIATTNHLEKLDEAFYRDGRFDVKITLSYADKYQMNKIYNKFIERNIPDNLLVKLPENKITPAKFIFTIKDYISEDYTDEVILSNLLEE
jgi:ATP-dependent 26S proteasome regulatory subunit